MLYLEFVAHTSERNYELSVRSEIVSQHLYMSIYSSVITEEIVAPYLFKQLVSCKGDILVFYKVEEQIIFFKSQICLFTVDEYISGCEVYLKAFKFYRVSGRLVARFIFFDNSIYVFLSNKLNAINSYNFTK